MPNGFYCFGLVLPGNTNHNAPDSCPIRTCLASQNDELCKNWRVSERQGKEEQNNVQYVENNVFFEPRKHIALHQIHKQMLLLATSYDPFKII